MPDLNLCAAVVVEGPVSQTGRTCFTKQLLLSESRFASPSKLLHPHA